MLGRVAVALLLRVVAERALCVVRCALLYNWPTVRVTAAARVTTIWAGTEFFSATAKRSPIYSLHVP
jgi:hypothetical protein